MTTPHTSGAADLPEAPTTFCWATELAMTQEPVTLSIKEAREISAEMQRLHALAARQAVAPVVDNKTAGHAMLWRQHCDKLDALVTYCPTCCQGFIAQKEMTRDQIIYECGKTAGRAALPPPPAMAGGEDADPIWVVNDLGELGVQVGWRFFFLYKGGNIEYGKDADGPTAMHDDETPMRYRMVGKREFGETCWPLAWVLKGRSEVRYTTDLVYTPGLSFGKPEDGDWRDLPAARAAQKENL